MKNMKNMIYKLLHREAVHVTPTYWATMVDEAIKDGKMTAYEKFKIYQIKNTTNP